MHCRKGRTSPTHSFFKRCVHLGAHRLGKQQCKLSVGGKQDGQPLGIALGLLAALLSTLEPVVSLLLAALLLGQALTELRVLGGVLILSAVILLSRGALRASEQVS